MIRSNLSKLIIVMTIPSLAFGIGSGGGSTTPPPAPSGDVVWWPAGTLTFTSWRGLTDDTMAFSEAWGSSRLQNLKRLTGVSTTTNLDGYEVNVGILGSSNNVYDRCSSYTQMPDSYDDCIITGFLEPNGTKTFAYGTYNTDFLWDNYSYSGNIRMYKKSTEYMKGYLEEVPMSVFAEAVYCTYRDPNACGLSLKRSHVHANQSTLWNNQITRYGWGGSLSYGQ